MIRKSHSRAHAGRRRATALSLAAAGAFFVVIPQLGPAEHARADGPVGAGAQQGYGPKHRPAGGPVTPKYRPKKRGATVQVTTGGPKKILPGATYTWPYTVTNKGYGPAKGVTFSTPLNRYLQLVSASEKCSWEGAKLVCRLGNIAAAGESTGGTITATVAENAPPGKVISSKTLTTWQNGPTVQKKAGAFPPVKVPETADLAITKAAPATVPPGDSIPYRITVVNNGPVQAKAVVLQDSFPAGAPVATAGTNVQPGNAQKPGGPQRPGGGQAAAGAKPGPKSAKPGPKPGGGPAKNGGAPSPSVTVKDTNGSVACTTEGTGFQCKLGSLPPNAKSTLTLLVKPGPRVRPGTVFRPVSRVSSATLDVKPNNNRVTSYTRIAAAGATPGGKARPGQAVGVGKQLPATGGQPSRAGLAVALIALGALLIGLAARQCQKWRNQTC